MGVQDRERAGRGGEGGGGRREGREEDQGGDQGRDQADHRQRHLPAPPGLPLLIRHPHIHPHVRKHRQNNDCHLFPSYFSQNGEHFQRLIKFEIYSETLLFRLNGARVTRATSSTPR